MRLGQPKLGHIGIGTPKLSGALTLSTGGGGFYVDDNGRSLSFYVDDLGKHLNFYTDDNGRRL